jgi:hypothetical protein
MSPQMNGEPRDASTATELGGAAIRAPASIPGDRPLLEPVNTDGVIQTTLTKNDALSNEDAKLAALFTEEATTDFRSRWDLVQRSFVDNPQEAVHAGDELVAQVIASLAETFSNQRSQLESELNQTDQSSTENLRLALRRYRSFFERLLAI